MNTQPEALRLADALDNGCNFYPESSQHFDRELSTAASDASAELRAQHELIQTLKSALKNYVDGCSLSVDAGSVARAALAAAEAHK